MLSGGQTPPLREQFNTQGAPIQLCIQMTDFAPTIYKCADNVDDLSYDYSEDFTPIGKALMAAVSSLSFTGKMTTTANSLERANVLYGPEEPLPAYDDDCPF